MALIFDGSKNSCTFVFRIKLEKTDAFEKFKSRIAIICRFLNKRYNLKAKNVNLSLRFLNDDIAYDRVSLIIEFII